VRGITINSFTSVSLDPPLILICIAKRARAHDHLLRCQRFCVNVLNTGQRSIAEHFAGRRAEKAQMQGGAPGTHRRWVQARGILSTYVAVPHPSMTMGTRRDTPIRMGTRQVGLFQQPARRKRAWPAP
jgi:hypothetical protein